MEIPESTGEDGASFAIGETAQAAAYYEENGYVVFRDVVNKQTCDSLRAAFDAEVKVYPGYLYRQTTANPEINKFNERGFVMNPLLNLQDLPRRKFSRLRSLAMKSFTEEPTYSIVSGLLRQPGKLVQSMYFEGNSETWAHQDTYYLDSEAIGMMVAAWFALEDIDAGAGRFYVVPKSHKIDLKKNGGDFSIAFNHDRYKTLIRDLLTNERLEFRAPCLRKGDALLWNAKTIHGSLKTTKPEFSRSSLTAHYIPESHRFLQFQSRIKKLKIIKENRMLVHSPKNLERPGNAAILKLETSFPKSFQLIKKTAIKFVTR